MKDIKEEIINYLTYTSKPCLNSFKEKLGLWSQERILIQDWFKDKNGKLLILGCGAGRTVIPLAQMGFRVYALDISPPMLEETEKKLKIYNLSAEVILGDSSYLSFENNFFDYIFYPFNGIDFVYPKEKRDRVFKEVWRVLKKDSVFIYSAHNIFYLRYLWWWITKKKFNGYVLEQLPYGKLITYYTNPFKEKKFLENKFGPSQVYATRFLNSRFYKKQNFISRFISNLLVFLTRYSNFVSVKK